MSWKHVARFTTQFQTGLAINQVVASYVNTDFWLDKITRESRYTREFNHLPKTSLPWAAKTRQHVQNLLAKKRTAFYFLQQLFVTCNNLVAVRQDRFDLSVVKRATSLLNSLCLRNVAKQVRVFCLLGRLRAVTRFLHKTVICNRDLWNVTCKRNLSVFFRFSEGSARARERASPISRLQSRAFCSTDYEKRETCS